MMFARLAILTSITISLLMTTLALLVVGGRSTDDSAKIMAYMASLLAAFLLCLCLVRVARTYRGSWLSNPPSVPAKQAPSPCPHCGAPLRTAAARYCRFCNMDWHDPNHVHKRTMRDVSWWPGPLPPEIGRLNREQQLVLHCLFCPIPESNRDGIVREAIAAARDFPSFLQRQLATALAVTEPGIETRRQLCAAGLVAIGDVKMVEVILNNMPAGTSPTTATGYCVAAPSNIVSRLLPLPDALKADGVHSLINPEQVREWFAAHQSDLKWDDEDERFRLVAQQPT